MSADTRSLATAGRAEFGGQWERTTRASPGLYRLAWRRFRHDPVAMFSLFTFILIGAFILGAPLVSRWTGFNYYENHLPDKLSDPFTNGYILGSDGNGRDILTRLAYGGRISLLVAFFATVSELGLGMTFGIIAGYFGKLIDTVIMRFVDVLLSLPPLPLLVLISTLFSPGTIMLSILIGAIFWPGDARLIRAEVLSLRGREYIEAARVVGVPSWRIILKHLIPNVTPIMLVQASLAVPGAILTEALISFLGLGIQVPTPSWGNMLDEAARFYRTDWTNVFLPGLMIYLTSLALYLIGIGLRDALDPRIQGG
jgi:ABC-type dipeptide/oligopeptide/nickel transport system permease subunit